jgi:hypothetical protein
LQDATFDLRCEHRLPVTDRHVHVGKREIAVFRRDEGFARHPGHRVEHAQVEHVPGAHLLLDHLAPCELDIDHVTFPGVERGAECAALTSGAKVKDSVCMEQVGCDRCFVKCDE